MSDRSKTVRARIEYTTEDGQRHECFIEIARRHPVVSVESVFVDGVQVAAENVAIIQELVDDGPREPTYEARGGIIIGLDAHSRDRLKP